MAGVAMQNALHLQALILRAPLVKSLKDETVSIRTFVGIKQILRQTADRERSSVASMIEDLIINYAKAHGLAPHHSKNNTAEQLTFSASFHENRSMVKQTVILRRGIHQ